MVKLAIFYEQDLESLRLSEGRSIADLVREAHRKRRVRK